MSTQPETSGIDLARQALLAAREAAKKRSAGRQEKPRRRTRIVPRDGRDPLGLGAAISMMMTERGLVAPAAGGSVLVSFDRVLAAVAPELAGHVRAVKLDPAAGRLDIVPDAPAYGTKVRWLAPRLVAAVNEQVPGAAVRAVHVLSPAAGPAAAPLPETAGSHPAAARRSSPAGPVKTPETASAGYRRAVEAHRAAMNSLYNGSRPFPDRSDAAQSGILGVGTGPRAGSQERS
ncbi:DUF721 domain-containing protein [Streptomyces roseolus]|uniref:DUF721 domain-containing protein n=1 Tax=Streptomyces roseolus TaxID=67358 RepID=UPI00379F30C5